jgi:dipeptidase
MTSYNMDCAECDWRVNKVPAADWPAGAQRPIYLLSSTYPRQVRADRGYTWSPENLEDMPQRAQWERMTGTVIGHIPQVPHTYALLEGGYGMMNEFQVSIGESTCASKTWAPPVTATADGRALLEVSELSQIALERCKTARCAVQLMGDLAVQYGYYSGEWDPADMPNTLGEGGEALTVADPSEAWMFHIVADDTQASAVWVARRVPDDHVTVVANQFVIRKVNPNSTDFLYSANLWSVAQKLGFWKPSDGLLDWLRVYGNQRLHPAYATLRVWRVFSLAAPSLSLPSKTNAWGDDYPFSVRVDSPLALADVMGMMRDHYEGTEFSTTAGRGGGPYGDPNRWDIGAAPNITVDQEMQGAFVRTISIFRTSYSTIAVARSDVPDLLGVVWLAQYAPSSASYTPLYVAAKSLPLPFIRGAMQKYDSASAWWNFCAVANYASRFYVYTIGSIQGLQQDLQWKLNNATATMESRVGLMADAAVSAGAVSLDGSMAGGDETGSNAGWVAEAIDLITQCTEQSGQMISDEWRDFLPTLFSTYRDGQVFITNATSIHRKSMFYPSWWLDLTGYWKIAGNQNGIYFEAEPSAVASPAGAAAASVASALTAPALLAALAVTALGFAAGRYSSVRGHRNQYIPI